jgi:all-trans-retinol 13,14-reductase
VTFVRSESFARWRDARWRRRGADYDAFKTRLRDRLLEQFLQRMPALRPLVAHAELSTPATTQSLTLAPDGAIYGLAATPERFANPWLVPRTPVPGLFLSGVDVGNVNVVGAMMSGLLAAVALEPRRVTAWLERVVT